MINRVLNLIKNRLLAGLFLVIPISVTYVVLKFLFTTIDGILAPYIMRIFARPVPGLGMFVSLFLLYIVGMMTTNVLGRRLVAFGDNLMVRLPLARNIYLSSKQLLEAFSMEQRRSFRKVVLVEYPRKAVWSIGFVTGDHSDGRKRWFTLFIPSTPNPTSGFMIVVPDDEVADTDLSIEEALKVIISGGVIATGGLIKGVSVVLSRNSSE